MTSRRSAIAMAGLAIGGVALASVLVWRLIETPDPSPRPSVAPAPVLTAQDLEAAQITSAQDVTDSLDRLSSLAPSAPVSGRRAVEIARAYLGRPDGSVRLYHGLAPGLEAEVDRPVWVVVFQGGDRHVAGPQVAPSSLTPYRLTGVIIDDQTGEILRWFMRT